MGLATSQVRLLALTSRKADVEMQMQLSSKRKSMLSRESSTLAKLYYAKLQKTNIQYATGNGYKDVNFNYLMYSQDQDFLTSIAFASKNDDRKQSDTMILVDSYGRVILDNNMLDIVMKVVNYQTEPNPTSSYTLADGNKMKYFVDVDASTFAYNATNNKTEITNAKAKNDTRTIEEMVIDAIGELLHDGNFANGATYQGVGPIAKIFDSFYYGNVFKGSDDKYGVTGGLTKNDFEAARMGVDCLKTLLRNGLQDGGTVYVEQDSVTSIDSINPNGKFYTNLNLSGTTYSVDKTSPITLKDGYYYLIQDQQKSKGIGALYYKGQFVDVSGDDTGGSGAKTYLEQLSRVISYYGAIFSAAFNGAMTATNGGSTTKVPHLNVATNISYTEKDGKKSYQYDKTDNSTYNTVSDPAKLQEGLRSGVYQLVNVSNVRTGAFSPGQGIDYFKAQNYIVEKIDNDEREAINAWYQGEKAALADKESQWDTEISELSTELTTITTEIESVKKLREDAITSTFKWGSA